MIRINLRDYYPFYKSDFFIEVTDEIAQLFKLFNRKEHADFERRRIYKAYYSLDAGDGIEKDIILLVLSPDEIYERKLSNQELYAAINSWIRSLQRVPKWYPLLIQSETTKWSFFFLRSLIWGPKL